MILKLVNTGLQELESVLSTTIITFNRSFSRHSQLLNYVDRSLMCFLWIAHIEQIDIRCHFFILLLVQQRITTSQWDSAYSLAKLRTITYGLFSNFETL